MIFAALALAAPPDETPKECEACAAWNADREPSRLATHSWLVGPAGLSVVAVSTSEGVVLLDAGLPQSAGPVLDRLTGVGLDPASVRWILVSHVHYDHVGGVAALQRRTGATVVGGTGAELPLRAGTVLADDPQAGFGTEVMAFPPVVGPIRTLEDGEALEVGGVRFTRVATPGHTTTGSSWTWDDCAPDGACTHLVFADSLNPVSAEGFRYSEGAAAFEASIARMAALPCDVLVPVHPSFGDLDAQARRARTAGPEAFVDPRACRRYADDAARRLRARRRSEARPSPG